MRPNDPTPFPLTKPRSAAAKRAAALHDEWTSAHARIANLEHDQRQARLDLEDAEGAFQDAAYRAERDEDGADLKAAEAAVRAATERATRPWDRLLLGAQRNARERESAFAAYLDDHAEELLAEPELHGAAEKAHDRMVAAIEEVQAAFADLQDVERRHGHVLRFVSGLDLRALPRLAVLDELRGAIDALRVKGPQAIPTPTPSPAAIEHHRGLKTNGATAATTVA